MIPKSKIGMAADRKLPILKTDFNVLDKEFNLNREKFETDMKKMEDEMNRFRTQIATRESEIFGGKQTAKQHGTTTRHASESNEIQKLDNRTWVDAMNSPFVNTGRLLKLKFDVHEYQPEEITVKTVYNKLQIQAKREEQQDNKTILHEYNREFLLPKGTDCELIKAFLSQEGILIVEAPLSKLTAPPPPPKEEHKLKIALD